MTDKQKDLCLYRVSQAEDTIRSAQLCMENHLFKDAINRSYYAAFYAVKAVLALADTDFKRHKDVVAYFNKEYVAAGIFPREIGRLLARLQKKEKRVIMMIFILHQMKRQRNKWKQLEIY